MMQSFPPAILTILCGLSVLASVCCIPRTAESANTPAAPTGKTPQARSSQPQKPPPTPKQSKKSSVATKPSTVKEFIPSETIAADQAVAFPVDM